MRRRFRRSSLIALALFVVILAAGVLLLRSQNAWLAERVAGVVTRNLLSERGYTLHLEGIEGRPTGELTLHQVRVTYTGGGHEPFDLFRAERVYVNFTLSSLFRGDFESAGFELGRAELRAFPVEAEGWAYPGFDRGEEDRSDVTVSLESVKIDSLLVLREREAGLDSVRVVDADFRLFRNAAGTAVELQGLRLERPDAPPLDASGRFFLRDGGMLTLAGVHVELPESRLDLQGNLILADGPRLDLNVHSEPVRLRELAEAMGAELDTDSYLRGDLHLKGRPDSLGIVGHVTGNLYGFELEGVDCDGRYHDSRLSFTAMRGRLNGCAADGSASFTLPLGGRRFGYEADTALDHFDLATFLGGGLQTDFSGRLRIEDPGGDADLRFILDAGSIARYPFHSAEAELNLRGDSLRFERVKVLDEGLELNLDGLLQPRAGLIDLHMQGHGESSPLIAHFAGDSSLQGHVDLDLRFRGAPGKPALELSGSFEDLRYLNSDWGVGEFSLLSDSLTRAPIWIHAEGRGFSRAGVAFDDFYLDADLQGDSLRLGHVSLERDGTSLGFGGVVDFGASPLTVELDRAWLRWLDQEWLNDRPLEVSVGDSLALGPTAWHSDRGSVELCWNRPEEGPDRILVHELDLAQLAPWLPERLGLSGRLSGELKRNGRGGLVGTARLAELGLDGKPAGEAEIDLHWLGDSLSVETVLWRPEEGREIALSGWLTGLPDVSGGPGALAETELDSLRASLQLRAERFPLESVTKLWPQSRFLAGDLTGHLQVQGPLTHPRVHSIASIDSCGIGHVGLNRVSWTAHLEETGLRLSHLEVVRGQSRLDGWARIPLELGLGRPVGLAPEGRLSGDLHLQADGADLLGTNDLLAEAGGSLVGDIALAGTVSEPEPTGHLRLRDGVLRFAGWEERLESLDVDALVRGDTLELLSLHAREGIKWSRMSQGELSGSGWLTFIGPFRYQLGLDLARTSYGTLPFFTGQLSGHLDLEPWLEEGVPPHPYVTGDLEIHEGTLNYSFDTNVDEGGATVAPVLSYDLDLRAEQNLMLKSDEADLELSGELHLSNTPGGQDISGDLRILRGHYLVFGNKFHMVEGYLDFSSAQDINPRIDILAETRNRDDRIQILITNTFAEPMVDVVSEQGYSREDVLRILMGLPVSGEYGGGELAGTVVAGRVETELLNRLERMVSGELAGLVDFGLENRNLDEAGEMETRWQIGRYLPGGLYISYNQGLSMDSDREVGLEYRLYNRLFLRSEIVNRGGQFAEEGLINEYNFDVRLRYEY